MALTSYGSRQNAERAGSADQEAQAATKSSEAAFAAARQQLIVLNAEIAAGRASVAQAKADLETARLNLGYTEIRSPIEGALSQKWGSSEGAGQVTMTHGSAFVSSPSLPGRDHLARDLALSPLHPELPRRGGTAGGARARRLL